MAELVHVRVDGAVATVTLDSPANRNALGAQARAELSAALGRAAADEAVGVVVLTHTGPVFCSGMDLKESRARASGDQGVHDLPALLLALQLCPKPVVARLAGTARAGGVGLVAACDLAVAADTVTFAFSEVRLGVVPAVITVPVLPLLAARAARELLLTGEPFDARRAVEIGLLTAAVPAGSLDDELGRRVEALLAGGPEALAATKRLLTAPRDVLDRQYADMAALSAERFASAEGQEGLRAFAEKRPPAWVARRRPTGGDGSG